MWKKIHLEGKPGLGGKQNHLRGGLISGISFSLSTPEPRCRGGVLVSQRSQTGTEPGRCSDQTYPHSEQGRSSLDLVKTFEPQTWFKIVLNQIQTLTFQIVLNLPGKRNNQEMLHQDCWGKNCSDSSTSDFLFHCCLKGKFIMIIQGTKNMATLQLIVTYYAMN